MNEQTREGLSAWVDGEASREEVERLIDAARDDETLRAKWAGYHLISDVLRNNRNPQAPISEGGAAGDLAARVSAALDDEPTVLAPRRRNWKVPGLLRQVGGLAVAASVTAVAILSLQEPALVATPGVTVPGNAQVAGQSVMQPAVESRLNGYLVNHGNYSPGVRGIHPYVRIVGYGTGDRDSGMKWNAAPGNGQPPAPGGEWIRATDGSKTGEQNTSTGQRGQTPASR